MHHPSNAGRLGALTNVRGHPYSSEIRRYVRLGSRSPGAIGRALAPE